MIIKDKNNRSYWIECDSKFRIARNHPKFTPVASASETVLSNGSVVYGFRPAGFKISINILFYSVSAASLTNKSKGKLKNPIPFANSPPLTDQSRAVMKYSIGNHSFKCYSCERKGCSHHENICPENANGFLSQLKSLEGARAPALSPIGKQFISLHCPTDMQRVEIRKRKRNFESAVKCSSFSDCSDYETCMCRCTCGANFTHRTGKQVPWDESLILSSLFFFFFFFFKDQNIWPFLSLLCRDCWTILY